MAEPYDLGGRLPLLAEADLSAAQEQIYQRMRTHQVLWSDRHHIEGMTSDGRLIGPYNPLLYSPGVGTGFLDFEAAEDQATSLDERTRQVVILSVGSVWQPDYEIYAHTAVAEQAGLSDEAIEALRNGQPADELTDEERLAQAYALQLTSEHSVDAALYGKAESDNNGLSDAGEVAVPTALADGTVLRITRYTPGAAPRHHRTNSIDYNVVISGSIQAELDTETVTLHAGDVIIQPGTIHNWIVPGPEPCVMLYALTDAAPVTVNGVTQPAQG